MILLRIVDFFNNIATNNLESLFDYKLFIVIITINLSFEIIR